jgi:hypothetical protein
MVIFKIHQTLDGDYKDFDDYEVNTDPGMEFWNYSD